MVELIHDTFLGLSPQDSSYEDSQVVIVRAAYDGSTSYVAGTRDGPRAIVEASQQVEPYDIELAREICDVGIHTLPTIMPTAGGPEAMCEAVYEICAGPARDGKLVFLLGGEHSVTFGGARAAVEQHGPLSFLQIDAHLDLRDSYEGSRFSHACVGRRLLDLSAPDDRDAPILVQVGIRAACPEELDTVRDYDLDPLFAHEIAGQPREQWIKRAVDALGPKVYVTLDVDGLDPSVIGATGTPMPGGLGWYDTLALLRAVGEQREVVACDVVELAPGVGASHASAFAAAQLCYKMIGYFTTVR
ncbi:MAG: agmatinase [Myxococcales bacterium]|nr:agmatinase [Myxococcales bacterium]